MNGIYVQKVHIFNKTIKTRCGNLSENYKLLLRNDFDKYVSAFIGLWKWNIINCRLSCTWIIILGYTLDSFLFLYSLTWGSLYFQLRKHKTMIHSIYCYSQLKLWNPLYKLTSTKSSLCSIVNLTWIEFCGITA